MLWLGPGLGLMGQASATAAAPDTTAPTLSSPVGTKTSSTTATIGATTDEGNGTMYAVVTTSATPPTAAQVKAGQNDAGTSAVFAGSVAVSSTGAKTISATGLTAATAYRAHIMHEDAAGNKSTVSTSASFTTDAATVLDATSKPARWTLSGGNLTGTHTGGVDDDIIRLNNGASGVGTVKTASFTFTGGSPVIGVVSGSATLTGNYTGEGAGGVGWDKTTGVLYANGSTTGTTPGTYTSADNPTVRVMDGRYLHLAKGGTYVLGDGVTASTGYDLGAGTWYAAISLFGGFSTTVTATNWP